MSDEQQQQRRGLPIFRLRRSHRLEATLNPEIPREDGETSLPPGGAVGQSHISVYGGIRPPHSPPDPGSAPLLPPHRRGAPNHLSSPQPTREDRSAGPRPQMGSPPQPSSPLGPSSAGLREHSPQITTSFVSIEGPSMHSLHAGTSSVSVGVSITNPAEASQSDVIMSQQDVRSEDGTKLKEGGTSSSRPVAKKGSKRGGMDADPDAKRKKAREASAKTLARKKATVAEFNRKKEAMEAELKQREDATLTSKEECEAAGRDMEYQKAQWCELESHFLQQGHRGREEWEKVLARIQQAELSREPEYGQQVDPNQGTSSTKY